MKKFNLLALVILSCFNLFADNNININNTKDTDTTLTAKSTKFNTPKFIDTNSPSPLISNNNETIIGFNSTAKIIDNFTINYPSSNGTNIKEDFISRVQLNNLDNNTLSNTQSGYSDFSSLIINVAKNTNPTLSISQYSINNDNDRSITAWIDFNQDGDFDDKNERILLDDSAKKISRVNISIPTDAKSGKTRMRIALKHGGLAKSSETFTYGEVEDYTINILENNTKSLNVHQKYNSNKVTVAFGKTLSNYSVTVYDLSGRLIYNLSNQNISTNTIYIPNVNEMSNGTYLIKVIDLDSNESVIKKLIK